MSRLELEACQAHVAPAVLPTYTTAALHFAALMSAYCLRLMIGSPTHTLLVSAALLLLIALPFHITVHRESLELSVLMRWPPCPLLYT